MTVRLSMSSLAGTARTLVAVGTARLACMLVTTRAAGPFSVVTSPPPVEVVPGAFAAAGAGAATGADAAGLTGAAAGFWATCSGAGAPSARGVAAAGAGLLTGRAWGAGLAAGAGAPVPLVLAAAGPSGRQSWKKSHQALSTLSLSARYCW